MQACPSAPCLDLTADFFASLDPPAEPLAPGNDWFIRLKAEDPATGLAINLTPGSPAVPALIIMTILVELGNPASITRRSNVVLGSGLQIEIDDQTIDNGTGGTTGRGWFKIRFAREDQDSLRALVGRRPYDIWIHFQQVGGEAHLFSYGDIDILNARTYPVP